MIKYLKIVAAETFQHMLKTHLIDADLIYSGIVRLLETHLMFVNTGYVFVTVHTVE